MHSGKNFDRANRFHCALSVATRFRKRFQGQNVTLLDSSGKPVIGANGKPVQTVCNGSSTRGLPGPSAPADQAAGARGVVDGVYYEFEPGQLTLADFAANGARCAECLTPAEVSAGEQCSAGTPQYDKANSQCTSGSPRRGPVAAAVPTALALALAAFAMGARL